MIFRKFYIVRALKIPIASGRVNIRICREDGPPPMLPCARPDDLVGRGSKEWGRVNPPNNPSGRQDVVWGGVE